jgi:hypothetical protein
MLATAQVVTGTPRPLVSAGAVGKLIIAGTTSGLMF